MDDTKPIILHVDDDPDIRLLMAGSLSEFGYTVVTAGTVAEALQLAGEFSFSLCILDVRLPDGTGIELCQRLRGLQPHARLVGTQACPPVRLAEILSARLGFSGVQLC